MSDETLDPLAAIQAKRAERKADLAKQKAAQMAVDLEAIDALEVELGDSNVANVEVGFVPGLPVLAAIRCPKPAEIKRYRARLKPVKGEPGDNIAAAEELGAACRIYPDADTFAAMCAARGGLVVQLGLEAAKLSVGKAEDEGKG